MPSPNPPSDPTTAPAPAPARALIREPRLAPVIGTDAHLPAVPADRLQPDALRVRFASTLRADAGVGFPDDPAFGWVPEFIGDDKRIVERPVRQAAVLVPLVRRDEGLTVLLTRRTEHLNDHAGQISFPGGRTDPEDVDSVATALREAREEV